MQRPLIEGDLQLQLISRGLEAVSDLAEDSVAQEALDLKHSVEVSHALEVIHRLRHSLRQYAERGSDLYYIGCTGHFSSGKSSTINSLLSLWNTSHERRADLSPTDTSITLLTHSRNESSLLGVVHEGRIPIRTRFLDVELLSNLVIADTPGTGDPLDVQEMARQFLPLCDLILFFFSATSAFDLTDLPLLTELQASLKFIPIKFVITRGDEFRRGRNAPLDESNLDEQRLNSFLIDIIGRLTKATGVAGIAAGLEPADCFVIDNPEKFRIAPLRDFLTADSDRTNTEGRIQMHSHKVQFFRSSAAECHSILARRLTEQFEDIDRIVSTARRNVERFQACVRLANLTIVKRWSEELQQLAAARISEVAQLPTLRPIPVRVADFVKAVNAREQFEKETRIDAETRAARIAKQISSRCASQISAYLASLQQKLTNLDIRQLDAVLDRPSYSARLTIDQEDRELLPAGLHRWIDEVRRRRLEALNEAHDDTKRAWGILERRVESASFSGALDNALSVAAEVLGLELEQYFEVVLIYHASVFARHVKEAISRAGLGRQLDELEHEMSVEQREATKSGTCSRLLAHLDRGVLGYGNGVSALTAGFCVNSRKN
jgi:hypothetical protein